MGNGEQQAQKPAVKEGMKSLKIEGERQAQLVDDINAGKSSKKSRKPRRQTSKRQNGVKKEWKQKKNENEPRKDGPLPPPPPVLDAKPKARQLKNDHPPPAAAASDEAPKKPSRTRGGKKNSSGNGNMKMTENQSRCLQMAQIPDALFDWCYSCPPECTVMLNDVVNQSGT